MTKTLRILLSALAVVLLAACGSDAALEAEDCGEGTEPSEDGNECVAVAPECGDNEVVDLELGRCVRAGDDYCADGTSLDETVGQCVADAIFECAQNTVEQQGECVVAVEKECGPGTVVYDEQCVPGQDLCGTGTEEDLQTGRCQPSGDVCGEGTVFDVNTRLCVPESVVECGKGTVEEDDVCVANYTFFDELAEDPDLDMTQEGASGDIEIGDQGERFSFVGNIDPPQTEDETLIQDEDVYTFEADAGQWLQITVFSLGIPEPGFMVADTGATHDYYRLSDVGQGIEASRSVVIPEDGTYEMTVSNLPQLRDQVAPAGGDDWDYVGYVEHLESAQAEDTQLLDDAFDGDITVLEDNFYAVDAPSDVDEALLVFDALPRHADTELQIWSDPTSLDAVHRVDGSAVSIEAPGESFYLLFDRVHAFGTSTHYAASAHRGAPLDTGDSVTEEIELDAGNYIGLFQFNESESLLEASITDGGDVLAETDALAMPISDEGDQNLYWYARESTTVTATLENTTGDDIATFVYDIHTGSGDVLDLGDGSPQEATHAGSLTRSQRHYAEIELAEEEFSTLSIEGATGDASVVLQDDTGQVVAEGTNQAEFLTPPGSYLAYLEARESMDADFDLVLEEVPIGDQSVTSNPEATIPLSVSGVDDEIEIGHCPTVTDINMDIDLTEDWPDELVIYLTDPGGDRRTLLARDFMQFGDGITGNFNETIEANTATAPLGFDVEPISVFEGTTGTGEWTLNVTNDEYFPEIDEPGTLHSWTLNLSCDA